MTPAYEGRDRRAAGGVVLHACTQADKIQRLVEYEKKQNGALTDLAEKYCTLDEKMDLILERIPHDLHQRLRLVEGDNDRRSGATGMVKWVLGLVGVGTLLAGYNFVVEKTTPLQQSVSSDGSVTWAVAFLVVVAVMLGAFAYLIRRRA